MSDNIVKDTVAAGTGAAAGGALGGAAGTMAGAGAGTLINLLVNALTKNKRVLQPGDELKQLMRGGALTGGGALAGGTVGALGGSHVGADLARGKQANDLNKQGNDMSNQELPKAYVEGFEAKCAELQIDPAKLVAFDGQSPEEQEKSAAYYEGMEAVFKSAGATDEQLEELMKQARLGGTMRRAINEAASSGNPIGEMKQIPVAGKSEGSGLSKLQKLLAGLGIGGVAAGTGAAVAASGDDDDVTTAARDKVDAATTNA